MEFAGSQTIAVPIEKVWTYLMDVNKVAACAPGFQSLEVIEPEYWKALVAVGIGPVKAKFTLDVTRPEMVEPEKMTVKARGKAPGSTVDLSGSMNLTSLDANQTQMNWTAHVVVGGTLASVGARLMNSTAEKLTGQFFSCLKANLQAPQETTAE
ncbi:CoxG family protein [Dictyobacter formicarum]|uniref:Carbon monoxide dehydrogenase n=1 Tax=Dictyobacter formicarum TaxID=2778368 RepID=A0ABQ3V9T4_9CHLR|nr:carbon monoxide dehydrogenase subunit G [Dictyobacter formicarum]GHO82892.1 carbon monoxide dehydrogenase [Dictyobacter formicarum]